MRGVEKTHIQKLMMFIFANGILLLAEKEKNGNVLNGLHKRKNRVYAQHKTNMMKSNRNVATSEVQLSR